MKKFNLTMGVLNLILLKRKLKGYHKATPIGCVLLNKNMKISGVKIADYAYLKKGYKYWNLWAGNPFCISLYKLPLTMPEIKIIKMVKRGQAKEKKRFIKLFKDVDW